MLDPHVYRSLFPLTERWAFFNHAGVSALNTRAVEAMNAFNQTAAQEPFGAFFAEANTTILDLHQRIMRLINATSVDEIVLMPNTATGINTAAVSLPLRPGDNVLILDGDYPANVYPWQNLAFCGILTKFVPAINGGVDLETLVSRIDHRTRVIALSTVQFATGVRNDLEAVGRICRERGIYFVVDGIQSLGALPFDVQAANVDMLACGSQKWLLGPIGAGFLYVRKELFNELQPGAYVGASSTVDWVNFLDYNFTPLPNANRFAIGSQNFNGAIGLHASLALIQEVGIEAVGEHILALADLTITCLNEAGFHASPTGEVARRSGIIIAEVADPTSVTKKLEDAGFVVIPRGNGIRIAPHFYNTDDEIRALVDELVKIRDA